MGSRSPPGVLSHLRSEKCLKELEQSLRSVCVCYVCVRTLSLSGYESESNAVVTQLFRFRNDVNEQEKSCTNSSSLQNKHPFTRLHMHIFP